jgi:hypothetical protein
MSATVRGKLYLYGGSLKTTGAEILSNELWELTIPRLKTDVPVWRDLSRLSNAPSLPRTGHALFAAGATLFLMGGDVGYAISDGTVQMLDTLASPDPVWRSVTSTPGTSATYQAVGSFDDVMYMYGGSFKGTVLGTTVQVVDVRYMHVCILMYVCVYGGSFKVLGTTFEWIMWYICVCMYMYGISVEVMVLGTTLQVHHVIYTCMYVSICVV